MVLVFGDIVLGGFVSIFSHAVANGLPKLWRKCHSGCMLGPTSIQDRAVGLMSGIFVNFGWAELQALGVWF